MNQPDWPRVYPEDPPPRPRFSLPRWLVWLLIGYGLFQALTLAGLLVVGINGQRHDDQQRDEIKAQAVQAAQTAYNDCTTRQRNAAASAVTYRQLLEQARPDLDPAIRSFIQAAQIGAERTVTTISCTPP